MEGTRFVSGLPAPPIPIQLLLIAWNDSSHKKWNLHFSHNRSSQFKNSLKFFYITNKSYCKDLNKRSQTSKYLPSNSVHSRNSRLMWEKPFFRRSKQNSVKINRVCLECGMCELIKNNIDWNTGWCQICDSTRMLLPPIAKHLSKDKRFAFQKSQVNFVPSTLLR